MTPLALYAQQGFPSSSGPLLIQSQNRDIFIFQSADFIGPLLTYFTSAGLLVDFTGASARMMFRSAPADAAPLVSITSTSSVSGQISLGGILGTIWFTVTKAATASIFAASPNDQSCLWDLYVDFPSGTTLALAYGRAHFRSAVTH